MEPKPSPPPAAPSHRRGAATKRKERAASAVPFGSPSPKRQAGERGPLDPPSLPPPQPRSRQPARKKSQRRPVNPPHAQEEEGPPPPPPPLPPPRPSLEKEIDAVLSRGAGSTSYPPSPARSAGSVSKIRLNCSVCGSALVDGLFQCSNANLSMMSQCRGLLCSYCSKKHTQRFGHPTTRTLAFDPIIADGIFSCPVNGCDQEISASDYNKHVIMCSYKELPCPLCYQPFALNSLCAHLVSGHEFKDVQLSYGDIIQSKISKDKGCIFRDTEEAFVFFILHKTLYHFWIGCSSNAADFKLMTSLTDNETEENHGVVRHPVVARCSDLFQVISFKQVPANVLKISIMID